MAPHLFVVRTLCRSGLVVAPAQSIEVGGDEPRRLVVQKWVDAKRSTARQVFVDGGIGERKKCLVGTIRALDARFLANTRYPLAVAGRAVPGAPGLRLPPDRIDGSSRPRNNERKSATLSAVGEL